MKSLTLEVFKKQVEVALSYMVDIVGMVVFGQRLVLKVLEVFTNQ